MTLEPYVILTTVLLLFPMAYLFLGCPAFLLVRLNTHPVPNLLRAMFRGYYRMMLVAAPLATAAYAVAGRTGPALGFGLLSILVAIEHRWFLHSFDAALLAQHAGDDNATPQLRRLHVLGMLVNMVQLTAMLIGLPMAT